jgi:hypothetical protein
MSTVVACCERVEGDILRRDDGVQLADRETVRAAFFAATKRALRVMQFVDEFTALAGIEMLPTMREAWKELNDESQPARLEASTARGPSKAA